MSSTTTYGAASPDIRVGDIISRSLAIWPRVCTAYGVFFTLAALPPVYENYETYVTHGHGPHGWQWQLISIGGNMVVGGFARAGAIAMGLDLLAGGRGAFGNSIATSVRTCFAVMLMAVCHSFGLAIGFALFVVPGLMLMSRWMVATPCCVVERLGPFASLSRSAELTKGPRWKTLGFWWSWRSAILFRQWSMGGRCAVWVRRSRHS